MRLRDLHRTHRRREVRPRGQPIPDLVQVALQIGLDLRDRLPVHSRCALIRLDFLPRLPDRPLRNLKRLAWCFQLAHTTPPGGFPVDRTNTAADNPAPSLQPHYRTFTTTTNRSASAPLPVVRLLLFPVNAADRTRVVYMPDTAWPISGLPPDSSRNLFHAPVLMSPYRFRHVSNDSLTLAFPIPT